MPQEQQSAREMVSFLIRNSDGDTRVALVQLAARFDEHMRTCPCVEPPAARPIPLQMHERIARGEVPA